jgi:hypothetical protein
MTRLKLAVKVLSIFVLLAGLAAAGDMQFDPSSIKAHVL